MLHGVVAAAWRRSGSVGAARAFAATTTTTTTTSARALPATGHATTMFRRAAATSTPSTPSDAHPNPATSLSSKSQGGAPVAPSDPAASTSSGGAPVAEQISARRLAARHRTSMTARMWNQRDEIDRAYAPDATTHAAPIYKRMADSYIVGDLPFASDAVLREDYINNYGYPRIGRLMEDLDALAGTIAYQHCDDGDKSTRPLTIVTASVDRIWLLAELRADHDLRMRGHVSWVGTSSMEICIQVESRMPVGVATPAVAPSLDWHPVIAAAFTMVARDPTTNRAAPVNKLRLESPLESSIYARGAAHSAAIKESKRKSLDFEPPTAEERFDIHHLYLESLKCEQQHEDTPGTPPFVWAADTRLSSTRICQPQERNIHGKLFGGYLMREAYELAFARAAMFAQGGTPLFLAQDDIQFRKPVDIGSILLFDARIDLARGAPHRSFQVAVTADVVDPRTGRRDTTNEFYFTFIVNDRPLRRVLPHSYAESIRYLAAMRRLAAGSAAFKSHLQKTTPWVLPPDTVPVRKA